MTASATSRLTRRIAVKHDVDLHGPSEFVHLHIFVSAEIADGADFHVVVSVRDVGENSLRRVFGGLPVAV